MKRSSRLYRLNRKEEKAALQKVVSLSFISVLLLVFIFTLGIPLLGKFADFLDVVFKNKSQDQVTSDQSSPRAPILDPLPEATNSARLPLSGFSATEGMVLIFNNDEKIGEAKSEGGEFRFDDFILRDGDNNIAVKVVSQKGKESDFSPVARVVFLQKVPSLEVSEPSEGQTFSGNNRIKVLGKTDKDVQVWANGFLANTNADGVFEVFIPLATGENNIEVKATDLAGNTKTVKRKVIFQ
ncbi:hypothetical protein HYS90_00125 [Candidatus Curtissbacteria bacterium]|nr:hypothetical protein [Candidatus Curtissbacteria bacterium]MBI2599067.1 hypothetical protein [Candidatus Curtissbacteria bacterium]